MVADKKPNDLSIIMSAGEHTEVQQPAEV